MTLHLPEPVSSSAPHQQAFEWLAFHLHDKHDWGTNFREATLPEMVFAHDEAHGLGQHAHTHAVGEFFKQHTSVEAIVERLARENPVDDENLHKCRFCLYDNGKGSIGLTHMDSCIWVAAVTLVLVPRLAQ